jgi:alpha-fucosidase
MVGQSGRLTAKISPDNTTDRTIVWKSDNESVAIVSSNGLVTAVSAGTASVTATCGSVTATCRVTVNARPETPEQYVRKGNGASCTFVVIMNLTDEQLAKEGYNFAYGYTDIHGTDIIISTTGLRYCHTSAQIYNDSGNDFWVYAYWKKEDGSIVSSMRRHLDGHIDEEFDINALNEYLSRSVNYEDPENWIQPTRNGAKICLTSNYNTGLYVHTMDGMTVLSKFYERGILVQEELISGQFVPGTYVVTVVSGEIKKSKKIIVR